MSKDNGGPAFPIPCPEMTLIGQSDVETQGMTLRDYFAAKAMQATLSNLASYDENGRERLLKITPGAAYAMADAMLKAREL